MAETMRFEIVSPERLLRDTEVAMVVVPGTDGDFTALPAHAPMMSTLRPGVVEIFAEEGAEGEELFVKGGLAQIGAKGLTILAEEVIALDSVSADDLAQKISDTREDIEDAKDDVERASAEKELAWMTALQDVIAA
ncbi:MULTISPECIES: F0F1 ATP synthase subunit epsilon [Kordiimonas]|uniref:F0F1 ATP synthase subunit epsilon n=1 Tax=Kordiimonas TaxID=288021 RepID=UPI001FF2B44C|nr:MULTISPECIES: F0F1 ATP synthase subunit epsilon [Kordiimonas]MCK0068306.1 F0F1 ATP synthase subunit epsilon [Kordiimonas laminariae]UTW59729.1 F0F1 ATP synthase subunit epsilon [Kordiimonas sp. SCSIO 12603]